MRVIRITESTLLIKQKSGFESHDGSRDALSMSDKRHQTLSIGARQAAPKKRGAWLTHISDCFKDRKCVIREITQLVIGDDQYEVVDIRWSGRLV